MKRLAWLLVALGTLLVQVPPVRATLRRPAAMAECCPSAGTCCEHPPVAGSGAADMDCSVCLPCCVGCAVLPAADTLVGSLSSVARLASHHKRAAARRDPPPLPPPR